MTYFAESSMAQLLSTWPGSLKVPSWDKWEMVVIGVEAEKKGGCLGTTVLSKDPGPFPCTPPPRDTQTCLGDPWGAALPSPATSSILSPYVHTLGCILRAKPATMLRHACKLPSQGGFQGPLASAPTPCCSALLHHHHPLPGPTPHLVQTLLLHADLPAHPELPASAPCPHCSLKSETGSVPAFFILSSSTFSFSLLPRPPELFQVS